MREAAAAPLSCSCPSFQHHLGSVPLPPRLFSSPPGGPLFLRFEGNWPESEWSKVSSCPRSSERSRGADRLFSLPFPLFSLGSPAGRTAPVGQPRRAWMSRRSHIRRWSCCCFASPCGYCNTIQRSQTPSFISVSIETELKNRSALPLLRNAGLISCNMIDYRGFGGEVL